jgi:LacI family transcriptional regulator
MAASIEDVAQRARVSISTVSRVINGRNVVNPKTRLRVEKAIRDLDYRPNIFARGLMLRRSQILGLVLPDMHGEFYSEIIRGANLKARETGYHLMVSSVDKDDDGKDVLRTVSDHGLIDGVGVMISELDARSRATLARVSIPFVVLDGQVEGVTHDTVMIDQRQGAMALMRLLMSRGVTRVNFVGGRQQNIDTLARLHACQEALAESGLSIAARDTYYLDYEYLTAYELGKIEVQYWAGPQSCVFAANDEMAAGVIHAATSRGLTIPDDLRVVGFDDTRVAKMIRPQLTTVHVPMAAMGATVIELLVQRLHEPSREGSTVTLNSDLVVRDSCGTRRSD